MSGEPFGWDILKNVATVVIPWKYVLEEEEEEEEEEEDPPTLKLRRDMRGPSFALLRRDLRRTIFIPRPAPFLP